MLEPGGRVVGQLEGQRLLSSFTVPSDRRHARISGAGKTSRCLATHALRKDWCVDLPGEPGVFSADARIRRV